MKLPVSFQKHRYVFVTFTLVLATGMMIYAGILHNASAQINVHEQAERQLSPVHQPERDLLDVINGQRHELHRQNLRPDWNLFRISRLEAEKIAAGKREAAALIDVHSMLNTLGFDGSDIQMITLHTVENNESVETVWRKSKRASSLIRLPAFQQIGTGYASGKKGRVWVVLVAHANSR